MTTELAVGVNTMTPFTGADIATEIVPCVGVGNVLAGVLGEFWSPEDRFTPPAEFHAETITL